VTALATFLFTAVIVGYFWHIDRTRFKRDRRTALAEMDQQHDEDTANLIAAYLLVIRNWEATSARHEAASSMFRDQYEKASRRADDTATMLTAERARTEILESELARIAEQVKGKCLWPTLADDDVVVALPMRGAL
jgi:hypothetical protein